MAVPNPSGAPGWARLLCDGATSIRIVMDRAKSVQEADHAFQEQTKERAQETKETASTEADVKDGSHDPDEQAIADATWRSAGAAEDLLDDRRERVVMVALPPAWRHSPVTVDRQAAVDTQNVGQSGT
jgi:hypothetical protein